MKKDIFIIAGEIDVDIQNMLDNVFNKVYNDEPLYNDLLKLQSMIKSINDRIDSKEELLKWVGKR